MANEECSLNTNHSSNDLSVTWRFRSTSVSWSGRDTKHYPWKQLAIYYFWLLSNCNRQHLLAASVCQPTELARSHIQQKTEASSPNWTQLDQMRRRNANLLSTATTRSRESDQVSLTSCSKWGHSLFSFVVIELFACFLSVFLSIRLSDVQYHPLWQQRNEAASKYKRTKEGKLSGRFVCYTSSRNEEDKLLL